MATKNNKLNVAEQRAAPVAQTKNTRDSGDRRPPESAENFEHTLRRLIAERDSEPQRP